MSNNSFDIINNENIKILDGYDKFFVTINKDINKYLFNKHDNANNYVKSASFNKIPVRIRFNEDDIIYRVQNGQYVSATKGTEILIGEYAIGSKIIITYKKNNSYTVYTETIEVINASVYDLGINNSGTYNEVNDIDNPYKLSVVCNKKSFTKTGGNGTISITSNTNWKVSNTSDWITLVGELSGEGNKLLEFTVSPNSLSNRSGNIVISSTTANKSYTIAISQQGESSSQGGGTDNTGTYPSEYTYKLVVYPESTTIKTNNNGEQSIIGLIQGFNNNELVLQKDVTNSMLLKTKTGDTAIFKSYANGLMKYDKNVQTSATIDPNDLYLLRIDNVVISGVPNTIYEENVSNDDTYNISGDVYLYKRINSTQMIASSDWTKLTIDGKYTGGEKTVSGKSYHFDVNLKLTDLVTYNYMSVWTTINGVTYSKSVAPLVSYDRIKYPIYYGKLNAADGFIKVFYPDTDHERHELRLYKHVNINNLSAKFNKVYVSRAKNPTETSFNIHINGNIDNPFVFLYNTNHIYYYSVNAVDPSTSQSITATGEYHQMESENNMLIHRAAVYCEADTFYALADPIQSKITDMQTIVNGTYTVYVKTEAFNYVGSNNNNNNLSSYPELVAENNSSSTTILPGNHNFNLTFSIKINNREYTDSSAFNIITSNSTIDEIVSLSFTRPTAKLPSSGSLPKFMAFELKEGTNITNNYIVGQNIDTANQIITSQQMTGDGYKKINYSNQTPFDVPLMVECFYVWANGTQYNTYEYFVVPTSITQSNN